METASTAAPRETNNSPNNSNGQSSTMTGNEKKGRSSRHNNLPSRPELHHWMPPSLDVMRTRPRHPMNSNNTTPSSTVLNSPDLSDAEMRFTHLSNSQYMYHPSYYGHSPRPQSIKVGKSPVNQSSSNANNLNSPHSFSSSNSPSNLMGVVDNNKYTSQLQHHYRLAASPNGNNRSEVVIFDDIGNCHKDTIGILDSPTTTDSDLYYKVPMDSVTSFSKLESTDGNPKIRKMIGGIQIADYEGSPRRFGTINNHNNNSNLKPTLNVYKTPSPTPSTRPPGFPQRVFTPKDQQTEKCDKEKEEDPQFDYVYEFSETRKVLEEFFHQPDKIDNRAVEESSQYIGERLANKSSLIEEDQLFWKNNNRIPPILSKESPTKDDLEIHINRTNSRDFNDTEMDNQIMRSSRNFTLSPETTDYDSNCGDLDSFSNDISSGIPDYGRLYTSMPVLEDGLSSGHASDTENSSGAYSQPQPVLELMPNSNEIAGSISPKLFPLPEESIAETRIGREQFQEEVKKENNTDVQAALKDIRSAIQRTKVLSSSKDASSGKIHSENPSISANHSPIWVPRLSNSQESLNSDTQQKGAGNGEDEEPDTDLETDRLLGQQRLEDPLYQDDKNWTLRNKMNLKSTSYQSSTIRQGIGSTLLPTSPTESRAGDSDEPNSPNCPDKSPTESLKLKQEVQGKNKQRNKEGLLEPAVLIEGVLFRAKYLGSTQLVCEGQPTKTTRMMQAEEAVSRIKAPEGESQPSTEVDLFISTEKIMVLNTDLKEIMMDHALRTISYIADIGDLVVLMARRRFVPQDVDEPKPNRTPKMICHVFESDEAQFIAQSIGQAFQVAYMEFLKANGIEDHSFVKEMDYQEVLNSQEIFGDELEIFAKKELQKEVVVPKAKGEILGVVIVESGWGSMLPTVVIANLLSNGAAARCGQLNIGDQIIAINGLSLVGLPLSTCQTYIRNTKTQTAVKFTVVPCPPVVEVKIKRPNTKYQLGFSVQNGVICSLLRGGIAERGGVRVGHRIIEINNQSVVAVPHEKIVNLLATSVGEILMKTMPTSMFRLLTGQENPVYI